MVNCDQQISGLEAIVTKIDEKRLQLAKYFCEDEAKFRLEDCLQVFGKLCTKIHEAKRVRAVDQSQRMISSFIVGIRSGTK